MAILFQLTGAQEASGLLTTAASRMRNTRPSRKRIGKEMLLRTQRRMRRGVDVDDRAFERSRRVEMFGGQTLWNRGQLAASANYATPGSDLELFSTDKRARVHYEGLEIRPKKGQFLAIPLQASGGLIASSFAEAKANRSGLRPRDFKGTFVKRFGGRPFIVQKLAQSKRLLFLFLLVRSAKAKRRKWIGFGAPDLEMAANVLGDDITGARR